MDVTGEMIKGMHHATARPAEAVRARYADRFNAMMVGGNAIPTQVRSTTMTESPDPRGERYASLSTYDQDDEEFYRQRAEKAREAKASEDPSDQPPSGG